MAKLPTRLSLGSTLPSVKYPVLLQVLQAIADGETPSRACQTFGTTLASLRYHLKQDEELKAMFDEALDVGSDALADLLINIDTVHSSPAMAGVISKNIQWLLERRKPDRFGARVQVSMENNATLGLIKALDAAITRIPVATTPQLAALQTAAKEIEYEIVDPLPPQKETAPVGAPPETQLREEDLRLLGLA